MFISVSYFSRTKIKAEGKHRFQVQLEGKWKDLEEEKLVTALFAGEPSGTFSDRGQDYEVTFTAPMKQINKATRRERDVRFLDDHGTVFKDGAAARASVSAAASSPAGYASSSPEVVPPADRKRLSAASTDGAATSSSKRSPKSDRGTEVSLIFALSF